MTTASSARRTAPSAALIAGCLAAAVTGAPASAPASAATTPPPAPVVDRLQRTTPALTVRGLCSVDGATLSVTWRRPGTAERHDVAADHDGETFLSPVGGMGTVQAPVGLSEPVGTTTVRLLERPTGAEPARRTVSTAPCDGWADVDDFTASGANAVGRPQAIGDLAGAPSVGPDGTRTWTGQFGRLVVVGPDGRGHGHEHDVRERPRLVDAGHRHARGGRGPGRGRAPAEPSPADALRRARLPHRRRGTPQPEHLPAALRAGWYYQGLTGTFGYDSAVAQRWLACGAERGPLGWPQTDTEPFAAARTPDGQPGDTWRRRFDAGTLYAPFDGSSPAHLVGGAIAERYLGPYWSDEVTVTAWACPSPTSSRPPTGSGATTTPPPAPASAGRPRRGPTP